MALIVAGLPLPAALAVLARGRLRIVAAVLAAALLALVVLGLPGSGPFVAATGIAFAAAAGWVRRGRLGYPELSLCALAGVVLAAALWAVVDPGLFGRIRTALEAVALEHGRLWLEWFDRSGLGPRQRLMLQEVLDTSAELTSRTWPAAVFALTWLGSAAAWGLAARRASVPASTRVTVGERCSTFRLPDAWLWVFVSGVAAYLLTPRGGAATGAAPAALHEAGLNLALIAAALYAWQGLAVVLYFLERRGTRSGVRILLVAGGLLLFPLPVLVLILALGLTDAWRDLRSRATGEPPAPRASS